MKRCQTIAAAALLAGLPVPAWAQDDAAGDAVKADLQCFIVAAAALGQTDEKSTNRSGVMSVVAYFAGKLRGRNPNLNIEAALTDDLLGTVQSDFANISQRCSLEAKSFGNELVAVGKKLSERGR